MLRDDDGTPLRLPGNLNVSFGNVDGEALLLAMGNLAVSSGAACTSTDPEPSHVLLALGLSEDAARSSLRFGLGRFNTRKTSSAPSNESSVAVRKLRKLAGVLRQSSDHSQAERRRFPSPVFRAAADDYNCSEPIHYRAASVPAHRACRPGNLQSNHVLRRIKHMGVVLTEKAANEVKRIIADQKIEPETVLRVGVTGGGCSGFSYALGFDK